MGTVHLNIFVSNVNSVMLTYNTMRVRRSIDGIGGTYNEITAAAPGSATLVAPTTGNYDVVAKTLQLRIDSGDQEDIVFTGITPLTTAQVIDQINAVLTG